MRRRGLLVVLSGPAGSGKSTLADGLAGIMPDVCRAVTATTRTPRPGEVGGADYFFMTREEFIKNLDAGGFVEHNEFNGNLYGTPCDELRRLLDEDKIVVLVIDVNGAHNVRKSFPNSTLIFLLPPTPKDLRRRLCGRGTECVSDIENRLNIAREEINAVKHYDFLVINDSQEAAVEDLRQIVQVLRIHHIRGNERQAWEENAYEGWHTSGGHDA